MRVCNVCVCVCVFVYLAIMENCTVQLGLNNPRCLLGTAFCALCVCVMSVCVICVCICVRVCIKCVCVCVMCVYVCVCLPNHYGKLHCVAWCGQPTLLIQYWILHSVCVCVCVCNVCLFVCIVCFLSSILKQGPNS